MLARIAHYLAAHLTRAGRERRRYAQAIIAACVAHFADPIH
jgi:hypothetical protein